MCSGCNNAIFFIINKNMMKTNAFKTGSHEQNKWLSTIQDEDIVPYGTTVDGVIAGANLPTSDRETHKNTKFVVMYAVPLHLMKSLVSQQEITPDVFTRTPFFSVSYPRGQSETNKYTSETCKTDSATTVCKQHFVSIFKHTFDFLKGTQGIQGNFHLDYEGSFYVLFTPYAANKPVMCSAKVNRSEFMAGRTEKKKINQENLLGLTMNAQDIIIVFLLAGMVLAVFQNQRLHEKIKKM
jgi:hypothetical protein